MSQQNTYSMLWFPHRQSITKNSLQFTNDGPTPTFPTHDLTHLLVAATSQLDWNPDGNFRIAEYNAVFLENLLAKVFDSMFLPHDFCPSILASALKHMRWFSYKHYAPLPIPAEEAYCNFCCGINSEAATRLSVLYFDLRLREYQSGDFKKLTWDLSFTDEDVPATTDLTAKCQNVFGELIHSISRPHNSRTAMCH